MTGNAIENIPAVEARGFVFSSCMGCGASGPMPAVAVPGDPEPARKTFVYSFCPQCRTLSLVDPPADMSAYYADDYYSFGLRASSRLRTLARRARNAMTLFDATPIAAMSARLASNQSFLSLRPLFNGSLGRTYRRSDSILDVGSGDGQKLYDLRELGFSNLTGVDPFMRNPRTAPNLALRRASLDDIEGTFDVVMFHHSMEHMPDPRRTLQTTLKLLSPRGVAVVRIPVVGGWAWRTFGGEWAQLDAPRHLHLFSRQGFASLATRSGWRVARTIYDSGALQIAGSRLRGMGINFHKNPGALKDQFFSKERREFGRVAAALNRAADGDQATFFLFPAE